MLIFQKHYTLIFRKCCIQVSENFTFLFSDFAEYLFSIYILLSDFEPYLFPGYISQHVIFRLHFLILQHISFGGYGPWLLAENFTGCS